MPLSDFQKASRCPTASGWSGRLKYSQRDTMKPTLEISPGIAALMAAEVRAGEKAIPTPASGKSTRGGRISPGEWERRTPQKLRFVYRRRGPSLLMAEGRLNTNGRAFGRLTRPHRGHGPASPSRSKTGRGVLTAPIFLLVPQVKLPKRLDLARDAERAVDGVPGLIVANWEESGVS